MSTNKLKFYTGIGSRSTPKDILQIMKKIAYKLAQQGYVLRSGAAQGADTAFENGCKEYWMDTSEDFPPLLAQIYLPWNTFTTYEDYYKDWYRVLDRMPNNGEAYHIASETRPAWEKCSRGAKALHARNVYQVLGNSLTSPSDFLVCWAKTDKNGNPKGGTRVAWDLAGKYNVSRFNLYNQEDKERLIKFVGE